MKLALWSVLFVISFLHTADGVCDMTATSSPNAPTIPASIQPTDSYQARVEVNILDKNYTMVMDEYLDYPGNRGLLIAYYNGKRSQLLYSYATNEVFHMSLDDLTCAVKNISDDPTSFLFGPVNFGGAGEGPQSKIFGSAAALRFAANGLDVYNGTGLVRGIPVDIWTTCLSWPNVTDLMKATFFFTQVGWNSSSPLQQMPVRIEIEGFTTSLGYGATPGPGAPTISPNSPRHFHHIYDFINYLPYISVDSSIFETPPGIVCSKRINIHPLPQFQNSFTYRTEIVQPDSQVITHYAVWYDGDLKMVREDKRTVEGNSILNSKDAVTEIHDFETGVMYVKDRLGFCVIHPINVQASDSKEDIARFKFNHSLIVDIRNPSSFFSFNDNYKYVGQRSVRGLQCDVYGAVITNFPTGSAIVNATFEYYFLLDDWDDIPLDGLDSDVRSYPVQLVISAPSVYYKRIYNFYDYAETFPIDGIFDASTCFPENQKLYFRMTFPALFSPKAEADWIKAIHMALLTTMNVHPIRITGIAVEGQDYNTYVNAILLGTANAAQFEKLNNFTLEHMDSKVFKGVTMPDECADLCINNSDFECQAFQYCPFDGYACRLLKQRVPTTDVLQNVTQCDAFSRTVAGSVQREPFIREAYSSLVNAIQARQFIVMIPDISSGTLQPQTAINVQVLSGQPLKNKTLPLLPTQFSYRLETVTPLINRATETFIWYDSMMNIVRYDNRDAYSNTPYMTTHIHDFLTGVAYEINQKTRHCKVSPIGVGAFDVVTGQATKDGSLIVSMRSPQSLFYLDSSYKYVGEKTVRGILCDVFEARRQDFNMGAYNLTQSSVFKFYFQSDDWDYVAPDSTDITRNQPVMLEIQDTTTGVYIAMNFYDFNDQHYTVNYYDTSACIDPKQKRSLIITFRNQPYHPVLDQASSSFLNSAILMMSEITMSSPIRFQQASVTYDDSSVYVKVTALGKISAFAQFSRVMDVGLNATASWVYANRPEDCADSCLSSTTFTCNSFDLCNDPLDSLTKCLLGQRHKESEGDLLNPSSNPKVCTHYSRSENVSFPSLPVESMYEMITDNVYDNLFQIMMDLPNNLNRTYVATDVRDDLLLPTDPDDAAGSFLRKFVVNPRTTLVDSVVNVTHSMVSVTDCASFCLEENTFSCETFDYKFTTGFCRLTSIHPDEYANSSAIVNRSSDTTVYSRLYTDEYTKYDITEFTLTGDKILQSINSDEMCAKSCTFNPDFTCESFDYCTDSSCVLRKLHKFSASSAPLKTLSCNHYSRNHLYDYILRDQKTLQVQFASVAKVGSAEECAELCFSGTGLAGCSSFTICSMERGDKQCSMTTSDPAVSKNIVIQDSLQCSLYTRANPLPVVSTTMSGVISSSVTTTSTTTSTQPTTSTTTTTTTTSTSTASTSSSASTASMTGDGDGSCSDASSNTGPRLGIAFGTLILGLIVGALCVFLFMKYQLNKPLVEDVQMLKTLNR